MYRSVSTNYVLAAIPSVWDPQPGSEEPKLTACNRSALTITPSGRATYSPYLVKNVTQYHGNQVN